MCERQSETETSDPFLSSELSLCNMHIKEKKTQQKTQQKQDVPYVLSTLEDVQGVAQTTRPCAR